MIRLSLATAIGALTMLAGTPAQATLATFGVSDADWRLTTGAAPWVGQDRARVSRTIDALGHATMDIIGIERISISAEYMAAILYMFVNPANLMIASRWAAETKPADDLIDQKGLEAEIIRPSQLYALLNQLHADGIAGDIKANFEKKANRGLEQAAKIKKD